MKNHQTTSGLTKKAKPKKCTQNSNIKPPKGGHSNIKNLFAAVSSSNKAKKVKVLVGEGEEVGEVGRGFPLVCGCIQLIVAINIFVFIFITIYSIIYLYLPTFYPSIFQFFNPSFLLFIAQVILNQPIRSHPTN